MEFQEYCPSLTSYSRWITREVKIGNVAVGADNPIRIQSMTTTDTMDTVGTIEQSIRMINAGCEIVRVTAPSLKDAENLKFIRNGLRARGYNIPLVADIHYTPNAAEVAARIVEKVRINPGNFADRKKFETHDYTDKSYDEELERIRDRFLPLVLVCKQYGTAMRIGTNHGSLSDRILSRYGDTPLGMVESAMEFIRICRDADFHDTVLSMKASNTQVMVQAYRLLVKVMNAEEMNYPLHLGVTEAGEAKDGRIKSAVGIGTLLEDGLGDTIRISLTEEPEEEIPVAKSLIERYASGIENQFIEPIKGLPYNPYFRKRRKTIQVNNIGNDEVPRVVGDISDLRNIKPAHLVPFGYVYSKSIDKWHLSEQAADYLYVGKSKVDFEIPGTLAVIQDKISWSESTNHFPISDLQNYLKDDNRSDILNFVSLTLDDVNTEIFTFLKADPTIVFVADNNQLHSLAKQRKLFVELKRQEVNTPVFVRRKYSGITNNKFLIHAATDFGGLQLDGFGDGVWVQSSIDPGLVNETLFGILQASRTRISKTEYISCPSCGRTLFDLQKTTAKIREMTAHLKGIKIGIMGCVVNGPGEMADADYGYVGTGVGKISLYKGQDVIQKNIPTEEAVDALISLIRQHNDWIEPESV
ncbi:MAG: (E)-4-hydroxy-3-methylbut-2-enyl-diphosphate synthase [Candidatus Neomarinimicrobiota bacterium]|nr:(E)-4-hydroxy-3-methylbut-2-enyl-diphosphate synthase [Candidatus Neomarinimicrobiota bacterium]